MGGAEAQRGFIAISTHQILGFIDGLRDKALAGKRHAGTVRRSNEVESKICFLCSVNKKGEKG
jgi:hypothetical protein